jgi:hypothetical protein
MVDVTYHMAVAPRRRYHGPERQRTAQIRKELS